MKVERPDRNQISSMVLLQEVRYKGGFATGTRMTMVVKRADDDGAALLC